MHLCSYVHEFSNLPKPVRETLEDESYRNFMGNPTPDSARPFAAAAQNSPRSVRRTIRRLLSAAAFDRYTHDNHSLSERLAHEAVSWCDTAWAQSLAEESFAGEEQSLRSLEASRSLSEARDFLPPERRKQSRQLADSLLADRPGPRNRGGLELEHRARITMIAESWRQSLEEEEERERERELGRALGPFVREIIDVLPTLVRTQTRVRDLFGDEEALWDLDRGQWTRTDWGALEETANALETLPELDRLAEVLGRSQSATETRMTERISREVTLRPVGLGKSEVTGVSFGDDLTSLLPSEVALLAEPETEDLFYAKLAHKEMLQLDYRRERVVPHVRERRVTIAADVAVPRGPVIVCLDTSGSMFGEPESVAKAMALALARRLTLDERDLHIIAFSTSIRSITLTADRVHLEELCEFLGGSFHGGTDLRPALAAALETLRREQFRNADVLVISDFRVPKIADRFISQIKEQQRCGTLFHSLTIARGAVKDPLHIFDNSWLFDVSEGTRGIRPDTLLFLT